MIDDKTFEKLAKLSAIHFDEKEKVVYKKELIDLIGFIKVLDEIEFDKLNDSAYNEPIGKARKDIPKKSLSQEDALKNVDDVKNGYIKVPKLK